jgi:hypothetical protein
MIERNDDLPEIIIEGAPSTVETKSEEIQAQEDKKEIALKPA